MHGHLNVKHTRDLQDEDIHATDRIRNRISSKQTLEDPRS